MAYDPDLAAVIQLKLDITRLLDGSNDLSMFERALFRIALLNSLDPLERCHALQAVKEQLLDLHSRIRDRADGGRGEMPHD